MSHLVDLMQDIAAAEAHRPLTSELAVVTAVHPHADEGDKDNYGCTVTLKNRLTADGKPLELKQVPVAVPYIGMTCIPNVDDLVIVQFLGGDVHAPVITHRLYNDADRPPVNLESEFQIKHKLDTGGTLKIDAEGVITLTSKSEENVVTINDEQVAIANESMSLVVDFSSETIALTSTKDITLKADGNVAIEGKEVALKSQAAMKIEAGAGMDIKASAAMKVKGATIDLN